MPRLSHGAKNNLLLPSITPTAQLMAARQFIGQASWTKTLKMSNSLCLGSPRTEFARTWLSEMPLPWLGAFPASTEGFPEAALDLLRLKVESRSHPGRAGLTLGPKGSQLTSHCPNVFINAP